MNATAYVLKNLVRRVVERADGAPIRFARRFDGKIIPVDYEAVYYMPCESGGTLLLSYSGKYTRGVVGEMPDIITRVADVPHFVTCRRREMEKTAAAEKKREEEARKKKIEEEHLRRAAAEAAAKREAAARQMRLF